MENKKPYHVIVSERLIEQLEAGTSPLQRPWKPGDRNAVLPMNPITGRRYRGINTLYLMSRDFDDQRWVTYKQAQSVNAQVRKGEKGTTIQYWKFNEEQIKTDERGKPIMDENGQKQKILIPLERPRVFLATVFNAEQIEGVLPTIHGEREKEQWDAHERAEAILKASGANIIHRPQDRAYYSNRKDRILLPNREQFESADAYYGVASHELGHWTGHESRLNRDLKHPFGSEGYAREELRAEIASMMLCDELGIGRDPGQHAAYVESWINVLKKDSLEIFRAASDAENIQSYILSFEQKRVQELQQPDQPSAKNEATAKLESDIASKAIDQLPPKQREIVVNRIRDNVAAYAERGHLSARQSSQNTENKPVTRPRERELER